MKRENLRDLLFLSVFLIISISGFIYLFTSWRERVNELDSWIMHSYNVIISVQKLAMMPDRLLIGERGYLLSGNPSVLKTYESAKNESADQLNAVMALANDNSDQMTRIAGIQNLLDDYIALLDKRLALFEKRNFTAEQFQQGYDEVDRLRNALTGSIHDLLANEQSVLLKRVELLNDKQHEYFRSLIIGGALMASLLLLVNIFLFHAQGRRQQAETRLADYQNRFQLAMRGTSDSIFDYDIKLGRIFYSRQFFDLLGREPHSGGMTMDEMLEFVHPDDHGHVRAGLDECANGKMTDYTDMYRLSHSDGHWIWVNSRGRTILDGQQQVERLIGATTDTTYLRLYQEKIEAEKEESRRASEAKSAFLAHMSHEIRTPLTAISGVAEILQKNNANLDAKQKQLVHVLLTSSMSMRELITDILDFSRIESGQIELDVAETDVTHLLKEVWEINAIAAQEKGIAFRIDNSHLPSVSGFYDAARLRQIMVNLVSNAIKFTPKGSVTVTPRLIEQNGQQLLSIAVQDTGIGIADEMKDKIFDQFRQGSIFINRQFGGTGLGLTISEKLTKLMGGHIHVESTPGAGSVFTLTLPYNIPLVPAIEPKAASHKTESSPSPLRRIPSGIEKRVLLAEDYLGNVAVISYILDEMGLAYDVAGNGLEAVEKWRERHYDAILMDVQMPEMDGFTASATIRAQEKEYDMERTPIICMTAHALMHDRDRGVASGMDDYLGKPISGDSLRAALIKHMKLDKPAAA